MILNKLQSYEGKYNWKTDKTECYDEYGIYVGGFYYELKCDICGKIFTDKKPLKKYCSAECAIKGNNKRRKERKATYREKECESCSSPFKPKRVDAKFCSNKCRQTAHRGKEEQEVQTTLYVIEIITDISNVVDILKSNNIKCVIDPCIKCGYHSSGMYSISKESVKLSLLQVGIKYKNIPSLDKFCARGAKYEDYLKECIDFSKLKNIINKSDKTALICYGIGEDSRKCYLVDLPVVMKECGEYQEIVHLS
jgi:predicted nucleic acid-binding Zn ribbon protein